MEATTTISFGYEVFNAGQKVAVDTIDVELSVIDLQEVAHVMEAHGGYAVEMCELEKLCTMIYDQFFESDAFDLFPDEEDFEEYRMELDPVMPQELVEAAEPWVRFKTVDQPFYLDVDGQQVQQFARLSITAATFGKMLQVARSAPYAISDCEVLREQAPEAYNEISAAVLVSACKYCIDRYKAPKPCTLRELAWQVYDNV